MAVTSGPLVTVLMPAYNAGGYIAEAVESILSQGIDDMELLVVDDGSTDAGMAELAAVDDRRIRVVSQQNSGLVAALNRGLEHARGRYVARMDADDICAPGRLRAQLEWFEENPDGIACGTDYEMFGAMTGRVRMPRTDQACRHRLLLAGCFCGASVMMRRDVIEATDMRFDPRYTHAEDYEFYARLAELGPIGNVSMVGYLYRIHPSQVSDVHGGEQRSTHLEIAAAHAERRGATQLAESVVRDLLWPGGEGMVARSLISARAGMRCLVRDPGIETARFCARKVIEAALSAR